MKEKLVIIFFIGFIAFVTFVYFDFASKCKDLGGITTAGGKDCWVEGRGYINVYSPSHPTQEDNH